VATGRYGFLVSDEYQAYWDVIRQGQSIFLRKDSAYRLGALTELLDSGFLVQSPQFAEWCASRLAAIV
jgi:hypothetical protein